MQIALLVVGVLVTAAAVLLVNNPNVQGVLGVMGIALVALAAILPRLGAGSFELTSKGIKAQLKDGLRRPPRRPRRGAHGGCSAT